MSSTNLFTELRNARVERILATKQNRILTSPWMRRTLSLIAIISSYALLATLLIPTPYWISKTHRVYTDSNLMSKNWIYDFRDTTQGFALVFLIWSFVLLRMSMRRTTSLPDQYLDELQITNRDWAFKTGYLVVRRIGLGLVLLIGITRWIPNYAMVWEGGYSYSKTATTFRAIERYLSDLSFANPFDFYFKCFVLLTFVAYSFPIILLAWREARFPESVPEVQEKKALSPQERDTKFYFASLKLILISFAVYFSLMLSPKVFITLGNLFYMLLVPLFYVGIPGSVVLFVWASVKTTKGIIAAKKAGFSSDLQKRWANITTLFVTITLVLGMTVGSSMFALLSRIGGDSTQFPFLFPTALIAGLLMIPVQAISMTFYAKLQVAEDASK